MFYDPMISKLITYGDDRLAAVDAMSAALDNYYIDGVTTNAAFLQAVMRHERFRSGNITTGFIEEEFGDEFIAAEPSAELQREFAIVAATIKRIELERRSTLSGKVDPNLHGDAPDKFVVKALGEEHQVTVDGRDGQWRIDADGESLGLKSAYQPGEGQFSAEFNNKRWVGSVKKSDMSIVVSRGGYSARCLVLEPRVAALSHHMIEKVPPDMSKFLVSPMPGLLIRVSVEPGQSVKAGEELAVVEAMKMENVLRAERDGEVAEVFAEEGASLAVDEPIISFA